MALLVKYLCEHSPSLTDHEWIHLQNDASLHPEQKGDLEDKLKEAIETHQAIEKQSRRLVNGKSLPHCKIVNAYDVTIAPIKKGKSNCATQFGKKTGIIAEMGSAPVGDGLPRV